MYSGEHSGSKEDALPFLPHYKVESLYKDYLKIIWFEAGFSQSRYNFQNKNMGSNACTLIAILMATQCQSNKLTLKGPEDTVNNYLIESLALSMIEGNKLYEKLKSNGLLSDVNLTVPEAISYAGKQQRLREWKSVLCVEPLQTSLFEQLKAHWIEWMRMPERKTISTLYVILIFDSRSVLFVIQDLYDTVTLIDSHQHSQVKGAVIAIVNRVRLKFLCNWFNDAVSEYYHSNPDMYELSFLYFQPN